jgi:hypothetical protein
MLAEIESVEILAERHKDATVIRVFLGDYKAKNVAVEPL